MEKYVVRLVLKFRVLNMKTTCIIKHKLHNILKSLKFYIITKKVEIFMEFFNHS